MLKIEHLRKRFGDHLVLDDINLEIGNGEIFCVIGRSGGGKSVILKHIIGLLVPDGGRILMDNEVMSHPNIQPAEFNRFRMKLGMLFQGAALFDSMSVRENLAFPLRELKRMPEEEIETTVDEALEMVGLEPNIKPKMPSEISGGMRSRVGLARAIVMKPDIMLYDEPTSALDPVMTDRINELITGLRDKLGMTSIIITHDIGSVYNIADKVAMIHEGKIIFHGTPAEIRASRNPYIQQFISGRRKIYYAVQARESEQSALNQTVDLGKLRRRSDVVSMLRRNKDTQNHDQVTGLPNEAYFKNVIVESLAHSKEQNQQFVLGFGDLDSFENLRREYGVTVGVMALQTVATEVRNCIRGDTDTAGMYEGGRFAVIMLSANIKGVANTLDRIRAHVQEAVLKTPQDDVVRISVSFGCTLSRPEDTFESLVTRTLYALKVAHDAGHNRVEIV